MEIKQQIATDSKTTAVVKHYGIERRSVFSTEGSFVTLKVPIFGGFPGILKGPRCTKILRDSELLRRSVFTTPPIFTTLWTPLRGEKCMQNPGKLCQRGGGGGHSKSLCGSKFTMPSKVTTS